MFEQGDGSMGKLTGKIALVTGSSRGIASGTRGSLCRRSLWEKTY